MLEFEECETSGHMRANGEKGEYWILDDGAWTYLERVNPTPAGPRVERLGIFHDKDQAIDAAEFKDKEVEE